MLAPLYPDSAHVRDCNLARAGDEVIWDFARENGFAIVSKDSDFHQRSLLFGFPPKVIWVRMGNCSTAEIGESLRKRRPEITEFLADDSHAFLILSS